MCSNLRYGASEHGKGVVPYPVLFLVLLNVQLARHPIAERSTNDRRVRRAAKRLLAPITSFFDVPNAAARPAAAAAAYRRKTKIAFAERVSSVYRLRIRNLPSRIDYASTDGGAFVETSARQPPSPFRT